MPYWKLRTVAMAGSFTSGCLGSLCWNAEKTAIDRWKCGLLTLQPISLFFFCIHNQTPKLSTTVLSCPLFWCSKTFLRLCVILFVLYNLLISTLWFPLRKSCSGFVLEMLSHIHTLSVEQFTITVIAGPSESPDRSLSFFFFLLYWYFDKKKKKEIPHCFWTYCIRRAK